MVATESKLKPGEYEIIREGQEEIMRINYLGVSYPPSVEQSKLCMMSVMDRLLEAPSVSRIILSSDRNYQYGSEQVQALREIANIYLYLTKQKRILSLDSIGFSVGYTTQFPSRFADIEYVVTNLLKGDPIGAYVELKRLIREQKIRIHKTKDILMVKDENAYLRVLSDVYELLDKTRLIEIVKSFLDGYVIGDRSLYIHVFRPSISPNFMLTRLMSEIPLNAEIIDSYSLDEYTNVTVVKMPDDIKIRYHLSPPEFNLSDDKVELLELARLVLSEHKPAAEEFIDPGKMRQTFQNIGRDLINELAERKEIMISFEDSNHLAEILVRYTVGFGLIELLLKDDKIQDIVINSPIGESPIYIVHQDYDECTTNIIPSKEDGESWATKFRMVSGRPLDEANPVLDTELLVPGARARVAIITNPLNPTGLGYAFRRHRENPWTFPLFIKNKMITPLAAGLLSFIIDGGRTMLYAGTRSSGKCVDGNTLIQISDGSILPIKNLVGGKKEIIDDGVICFPNFKYEVPCLDNFNIQHSKITDVWKRTSPEKVIKLKTKSGREIITTEEHPYFTYDGSMKNVRADELRKGDFIAIPRKIELKNKKQVLDLTDENYFVHESDNYFVLKGKTNSLTVKFPKEITTDLAEFLGLIVGDGHLDLAKVELSNQSECLRNKAKLFLKSLGVNYREFKDRDTMVVQATCRVLSKILNKYFEIPFGKKADKVIIPGLILKSPDHILAAFLKGYFDTDGYIAKGKRDIELCTASKMMVEHLKMALLRFNIVCFSKVKIIDGIEYYRQFIRGSFVNKFAKSIGFSHPNKKERLNEIISHTFLENTNVDVIPKGNEIVTKLSKKLRISPKHFRLSGKDYWAYENEEYRVSRNWFSKLIKFYGLHYEKLKSIGLQVGLLRKFINFDYNDYISKIDKLRVLLGVSYVSIASDIKLSDATVRKSLQKNVVGSFEKVKALSNLKKYLINKFGDVNKFCSIEPVIENMNMFIKSRSVSYAELSRRTNIPETTLKSYSYGNINPSLDVVSLIEHELFSIKENLIMNLKEANSLLTDLDDYFPESIQVGLILSNLRTLFNVKNEELISDDVSLQTVSNFFSGKHPFVRYDVVHSIIKSFVDIFDSCVCEESERSINEASMLANSDIFWDEVSFVETINKIDDFVYDLTVKDKHNFVANGMIAHNTSLLSASMIEIMRNHRIITVEDTLEIPVRSMRKLGYNIQSMKVRSALASGGTELAAEEGIRTSLRMGDSSLIVGEVRSKEALALYEAMRVGALANVVAGTIHGGSPYAVFDRVVNDLGVPRTSFKATDIIIVANPIKSPDGLHRQRRVVSITEVRKEWETDPLREKGFVELMKYNPKTDELEPTPDLINGDSEIIKEIAGTVKEWVGDWDAVWQNIELRAKLKKRIVDYAEELERDDILESHFVVKANDMFHIISDEVLNKFGKIDNDKIYFRWNEWLKKEVKKE